MKSLVMLLLNALVYWAIFMVTRAVCGFELAVISALASIMTMVSRPSNRLQISLHAVPAPAGDQAESTTSEAK